MSPFAALVLIALAPSTLAAPAPHSAAHQKAFAKAVIKALKHTDHGRYKWVKGDFALLGPAGQQIQLVNFYDEFLTIPEPDQLAWFVLLTQRVTESTDTPDRWEPAQGQLLPRVRPMVYYLSCLGPAPMPTCPSWSIARWARAWPWMWRWTVRSA